ncbi:MAG: hypothetical protein C0505_08490 [Leptothrix sp. (in: Bacteria)]|nr:hypothetical protein [Leptothrix sp. (in: b-proteobacteria)]
MKLFNRPVARLLAPALACLIGCATPSDPSEGGPGAAPGTVAPDGRAWHEVPLPGKPSTRYQWTRKDGRDALAAASEASASMYRHRVRLAPAAIRDVSFSWWVQDLVAGGSVADAALEDAPARVLFGFGGDLGKLSRRTRVMFELAEVLTGEQPPYATLMYVWDATAPVGSVIVNPRSDRIRKIVVDSGPGNLRRWRLHRRDLAADFRLAFGEAPGELTSIAVMTDSDNTRSSAKSWYGPVELH